MRSTLEVQRLEELLQETQEYLSLPNTKESEDRLIGQYGVHLYHLRQLNMSRARYYMRWMQDYKAQVSKSISDSTGFSHE